MNKENTVTIQNIIDCLEEVAPLKWQESYDNAGLITGNPLQQCTGVQICLDVFPETLQQAVENNCNLVVSHHPFIFKGIKKLEYGSQTEQILSMALSHNIAVYASHTNMDSSFLGINSALAEQLELKNIFPIDNNSFKDENMYLGEGAWGYLPESITAKEFLNKVKEKLSLPCIRFAGNENKPVKSVAICGGAGSFLIEKAIKLNCDMFLTGDLKYHDFLSYYDKIIIADIGHFESEQFIKNKFVDIISKKYCNFAPLFITQEKNRIKFL